MLLDVEAEYFVNDSRLIYFFSTDCNSVVVGYSSTVVYVDHSNTWNTHFTLLVQKFWLNLIEFRVLKRNTVGYSCVYILTTECGLLWIHVYRFGGSERTLKRDFHPPCRVWKNFLNMKFNQMQADRVCKQTVLIVEASNFTINQKK